jgi:predicted adenine nucleotide alpha hydrolase (AANH) superfamily ATPase
MRKLLLHVCCGPCGIYPLSKLKADYQVSVFYYNPNIHPETEYQLRKNTVQNYCQKNNIEFIEEKYSPDDYFQAIKDQEENKLARCPLCYRLRLEKTAQYAQQHDYEIFSSTLLISPHQDINLIKKIGEKIAEKYNLEFYTAENKESKKKYKGFRQGFALGRQKAKQEHMYFQHYCGCIFSRNEL